MQPKNRNTIEQVLVKLSLFLLIFVLGLVDFFLGPLISVFALYLIPLYLAFRVVDFRSAIVLSIFTVLTYVCSAVLQLETATVPAAVYCWNVGMQVVGIGLFSGFLAQIKKISLTFRNAREQDQVTGVLNVEGFLKTAELEIQKSRRFQRPVTVAVCDIDDFKILNHRLGHSKGNLALRTFARTIRNSLRAVDIVARVGGDEFVVLFPETSPDQAEVVINKLKVIIEELIARNNWPVSFSAGVVTFFKVPASIDEVLLPAEALMRTVKQQGKHSILFKVAD